MKQIKKIILLSILIIVAICQLSHNVFAYTIDEVKEMINYHTVEEDGEPEEYDILIDSSLLKDYVEVPNIRTTIEPILYNNDGIYGLLNINFFDLSAGSSNTEWGTIASFVRTFFRVSLYIAVAGMLTLLIYMAVVLVSSSISSKDKTIMPMGGAVLGGNGNPRKRQREKSLVEQWIISVILLALIAFIINLSISFSGIINNIATSNAVSTDSIIIYVADLGGEENPDEADIDTTDAYYFTTNLEGALMFQTQYDWKDNAVENITNFICGMTLTIFKIFIYVVFLIRMLLVAVLIAIAPIVILISAFDKIYGNKGYIKDWFKLLLYLLLLRPIVGILYYLLIQSKPNLVTNAPFYMFFIVILLIIAIIVSIKMAYRSVKKTAGDIGKRVNAKK